MKLSSAINMGASVNLLHGLKPEWDFSRNATPFFPLEAKPLQESDIDVTSAAAEWGYPDISLHESAEDLSGLRLCLGAVQGGARRLCVG